MEMEERSQIPVEWVDAEEWDAIEQALAAATSHFATSGGVEQSSSSAAVAREDESKDGYVGSGTAGESLTGEAAGCSVLSRHELDGEVMNPAGGDVGGGTILEEVNDDHMKRPRRTLPAWGQKKLMPGMTQVQAPQVQMKIEPDTTEVKPVVVQTNLSRLTDSWAMGRPACKPEKVHSRSQYLQFKGRLVYSKTSAEVDAAAHDIWEIINAKRVISPGTVAVGFDLEWKTSFQRGGAPGKVAVIQLCLESSRCDVMQIVDTGIPPSLATILEDSSIVKTGIGSRGDASKLQNDYGIQTRGVVDLAEMANQKLGRRWQSWSLSSLAEELTCKKIEKVSGIRCGDWEACPLSSPQLQYAATDAFASLYLYQILETFSSHTLNNEESSSDSHLMQQGST
ncbi:hypothetical protein KC19_4G155400 [Ceratodon purpureus]|uniref:3'-5' exonuclease n=1 Tax=Ceratodon purpureus TaxID=3225 RepID=A0A8T0IBA8_CERPU|nr:hypothetical protein KC19_4G155400 [Ceratodon purpureus]